MARRPTAEIWVDSFAGGGGASYGMTLARGRGPDIAINHDAEAIALHAANHPDTKHYTEDVWAVDPKKACKGRPVGLMWLSPDCKHFSKAKGGKPVSPRVRGLAWVAVRWARSVQPRIIVLENVEEFQGWGPLHKKTGKPDKSRAGLSFRIFVGRLRGLGYVVEWRELRGCDYGAPTIRKRLFLVARRDGQAIVWPTATHGKGHARPWRTAAECIDFDRPCPSIFGRKKPLAFNTQRRIAAGLQRFVFEADRPFIVQYHSPKRTGDERHARTDAPFPTLDTSNRFGLVAPHLVPMQHQNRPTSLEEPLQTITTQGNKFNLVAPLLVPRYGEDPDPRRGGGSGQRPRAQSVEKPLSTIVPTQNGASLVAGFLAKHYGGNETPGTQLGLPLSTITTQDHHHLVAASLVNLRGTHESQLVGRSIEEPLPTISSGGIHAAEVRAFLVCPTCEEGVSVYPRSQDFLCRLGHQVPVPEDVEIVVMRRRVRPARAPEEVAAPTCAVCGFVEDYSTHGPAEPGEAFVPHRFVAAPPRTPLDVGELKRLAQEVFAADANLREHPWSFGAGVRLANATRNLEIACTPARISRLVAEVEEDAAESERQFLRAERNYAGWDRTADVARGLEAVIDVALTEMREPMTLADARRARDLLTHAAVERGKANAEARASGQGAATDGR